MQQEKNKSCAEYTPLPSFKTKEWLKLYYLGSSGQLCQPPEGLLTKGKAIIYFFNSFHTRRNIAFKTFFKGRVGFKHPPYYYNQDDRILWCISLWRAWLYDQKPFRLPTVWLQGFCLKVLTFHGNEFLPVFGHKDFF